MAQDPPARCDVLATSLTLDATGKELLFFRSVIQRLHPAFVVLDAPVGLDLGSWVEKLREAGWVVTTEEAICTQFGDL